MYSACLLIDKGPRDQSPAHPIGHSGFNSALRRPLRRPARQSRTIASHSLDQPSLPANIQQLSQYIQGRVTLTDCVFRLRPCPAASLRPSQRASWIDPAPFRRRRPLCIRLLIASKPSSASLRRWPFLSWVWLPFPCCYIRQMMSRRAWSWRVCRCMCFPHPSGRAVVNGIGMAPVVYLFIDMIFFFNAIDWSGGMLCAACRTTC